MTSLRWTSIGCVLLLSLATGSGCGNSANNDDDESGGGEDATGGEAGTGGGGTTGTGGAPGTGGAATGGRGGTSGAGGAGGTTAGAAPTGGGGSVGTGGAGGTNGGAAGAGTGGRAGAGTGGGAGAGSHREVTLTVSATDGFDYFGSRPGCALGVAVDETSERVLVVALKYDLPLYTGTFMPAADVAASAAAYRVSAPVSPLADAAASYPLVTAALTDTASLLAMMTNSVTAVLLEGDLGQATPQRIYVAHAGMVTITREEKPIDILQGAFSLTEVTGLGPGAMVAATTSTIDLAPFDFEIPQEMP